MELTLEGSAKEIVNGIEYRREPGTLSVLFPWHIHEIIPDEGSWLYLFKCSFGLDVFFDNNGTFSEINDLIFKDLISSPVVQFEQGDFARLVAIFEDLQAEYQDVEPWKNSLVKAKISEILIRFDRRRKAVQSAEDIPQDMAGTVNTWEVLEYLHSSYSHEISLEDLAQKFHCSEAHLNRLLKQLIGLNFDNLLQEIRIRNSCAMLAYPAATIAEVGLSVGYSTPEAFYRAFKRVKGLSPENYRRLYYEHMAVNQNFSTLSILNAQIIYYLHLHFSENLTLSSLAQKFHYSEAYLSETLNQHGESFTNLLHEIRIYHACALLLSTNMHINDIGYSVGFDSTETFFRVFKKLRGIPPGEFRRRNQKIE